MPEAFRYQQYSPNEAGQSVVLPKERGNQIQAPYSKHLLSPLLTPTSLTDHKQKDLGHIHALAYREVLAALKDMNITNQVRDIHCVVRADIHCVVELTVFIQLACPVCCR